MTRREVLQAALAAAWQHVPISRARPRKTPRLVVLVTIGGIRRQESFSTTGVGYIPRIYNDLTPRGLFFPFTLNEGVTSHFNTIASVLTGRWQRVDDWGTEPPADPTLFSCLQHQLHAGPEDTWVVTSNKQVTANISPGANVVLSKQLMIEAVERIIMGQSARRRLEREQLLQEMTAIVETDYERIGWGVPSASAFQDSEVKKTFVAALTGFIRGPGAPVSGDELTFLVAREVLERIAPALLLVNFSDVEVAHSGAYSLHLGGIRRADALCYRLWEHIQANAGLRERATLVIMDEFGRDPDGSSTNGFFNHRTDTECCRMAWMLVLGKAVAAPRVVERVVRHIDLAPSIAAWMGFECERAAGSRLPGFGGEA